MDGVGFFGGLDVEGLDEDGEGHGEVDVALGDVVVGGFGEEVGADEEEEGEGEDFDGGVFFDEVADGIDGEHHDDGADEDGNDHDGDLFDHADGGDDGVEAEDHVHEHDLDHDLSHGSGGGGGSALLGAVGAFELVVDFADGLDDEEETADEEDEVLAGEGEFTGLIGVGAVVSGVALAEGPWDGEEGFLHAEDEAQEHEEDDSGDDGEDEAFAAGFLALVCRQFAGEDGDEDDVIDAEDDFEEDECEETDPCRAAVDPREVGEVVEDVEHGRVWLMLGEEAFGFFEEGFGHGFVFAAAGVAEFLEFFLLIGGEVSGDLDLDADHEVAFGGTLEAGHAFAAEAEDGAALGTCGYFDGGFAFEGGDDEFAAEGGFGEAEGDFAVEVVVFAGEDFVATDVDDDVEVAGWAAAHAVVAVAAGAEASAFGDACGDAEFDAGAFFDPTLASAIGAGVGNDLACAVAIRAGLLDLEEAAGGDDLACAAAGGAGFGAAGFGGA